MSSSYLLKLLFRICASSHQPVVFCWSLHKFLICPSSSCSGTDSKQFNSISNAKFSFFFKRSCCETTVFSPQTHCCHCWTSFCLTCLLYLGAGHGGEDTRKHEIGRDGKCMRKVTRYHVSNSVQCLPNLGVFCISLFLNCQLVVLPAVSLE